MKLANRLGRLARLTTVLTILLLLAGTPNAYAKSRNAQRLELRVLAVKASNNSLKYLHGSWWRSLYSYQSVVATLPGASTTETVETADPLGGFSAGEKPIRSQASALYATALALNDRTYSAKIVGVSGAEARHRVIAWTNSLALSYARDGWGHGFQSGLWTYYLAFGAQQVWGSLPASTQTRVNAAVSSEADFLLLVPPPYFRDTSGTVICVGDSKSEEDAWNGALLALAARTMPADPHAAQWLAQARQYSFAAYSSPGQSQQFPQLAGSNINPDGSITNDARIVYPDYMFTQAEFLSKNALLAGLAHSAPDRQIYNNQSLIWRALTRVKYVAPPFNKPGGTIYRVDGKGRATTNIFFPSGTTRSRVRRFNAAQTDVEAFASRIDSRSYLWAKAHLGAVIKQQARHKDGRIFSSGETQFPEDEQFAAASEAEMIDRLGMIR